MGSMLKKVIIPTVLILIALIAWYSLIPFVKDLSRETLDKRISIQVLSERMEPILIRVGPTKVVVDLAVSDAAKQQGLAGVRSLRDDHGMLFVFDQPGYPGIWMKGMSFPIDIIWIDKDFKIVDVEKKVSPNTYPRSFEPDLASKYVLEVNAGFFDEHGLKIGDPVGLPDDEEIKL